MKISISEIGSFLRCRRAWDWGSANRLNLSPVAVAPALWLGTGIHVALDQWYRGGATDLVGAFDEWASQSLSDRVDRGEAVNLEATTKQLVTGRAMLAGYRAEYGPDPHHDSDGLLFLTSEQQFQVPIPDTEEGWLVGTIDALARDGEGRIWVVDHKTAASFPHTTALAMDPQFTAYVWATMFLANSRNAEMVRLGITARTHIAGVLYNGLRKQAPGPQVKAPLFHREYLPKWSAELQVFQDQLAVYHSEMANPTAIYPTVTKECGWCSFQAPCFTEQQGGNAEDILAESFYQAGPRGTVYPYHASDEERLF